MQTWKRLRRGPRPVPLIPRQYQLYPNDPEGASGPSLLPRKEIRSDGFSLLFLSPWVSSALCLQDVFLAASSLESFFREEKRKQRTRHSHAANSRKQHQMLQDSLKNSKSWQHRAQHTRAHVSSSSTGHQNPPTNVA